MTTLRWDSGRLLNSDGEPSAWPRLAVIGWPVAHSLSPVIQGAALKARGLSGDYARIEVAAEGLASFLNRARSEMTGLNVTLPHKAEALFRSATASREARSVGVANTLVQQDGAWHAANTDVPGLALALQRFGSADQEPWRGSCWIVGAGGAARAAVAALQSLGASEIIVTARRPQAADWARTEGAEVVALQDADVGRARLLIQATPLGLRPDDPIPVSVANLRATCYVMDLTYAPRPSLLLQEAARRGCPTADGRFMLVAQGALSFALWFGGTPPLNVMATALGWKWE